MQANRLYDAARQAGAEWIAAEGEELDDAAFSAARRALDTGTDVAHRTFLDGTQYTSARTDDRIAVDRLPADDTSGPEPKATAPAALDRPPTAPAAVRGEKAVPRRARWVER